MNLHLDGKNALVTGASRGIGRAIALSLGAESVYVVGTATTETGVNKILAEFSSAGVSGTACVLDVTDPESINQLGHFLKERQCFPDILVNNAGITRDNLLLRMKDEEWNDVINADLNSVFRLSRLCLKNMMKARYGRIINITSVVALSGNPGQANYAAAKAGMIGFTRSLAKEVGSRNITVNAVAPGFITTDMTESLSDEQQAQLKSQIALGRLGIVDEVADVVVFLASPAAGYITGETINVNGGMYMA